MPDGFEPRAELVHALTYVELRTLAQQDAEKTFKRLVSLRDQTRHLLVALGACKEILDRGYGTSKPGLPFESDAPVVQRPGRVILLPSNNRGDMNTGTVIDA